MVNGKWLEDEATLEPHDLNKRTLRTKHASYY